MKKEEIHISKVYAMKVGKNTVSVRIMSEHKDGGWVGANIKTNKEVIIRSADRLIGLYQINKENTNPAETQLSKDAKPTQVKKLGGLLAAFMVLADAKEPLDCQEIVKRMIDQGMWKTGGKTPASTLHSAISREIKEKGTESRFAKTERGKFTIVKK
ncbi:MAG: winged helix-turn-helix domain-containing protein [Phycisphaerales bacterium]